MADFDTETSYNSTLEKAIQQARLTQATAIERFNKTRDRVVIALTSKGLSEKEVQEILEVHEILEEPSFRSSWGALQKANPLNSVMDNSDSEARKAVDKALRGGLDAKLLSEYIADLRSYRKSNEHVASAEQMVFEAGGSDAMRQSSDTTKSLMEIRSDLAAFAKRINPSITIDTAYKTVGADPTDLDPLKKVLSVSLEASGGSAKKEMAKTLFGQLEPLLGDKEIALIKEEIQKQGGKTSGNEFHEAAANLFADHVAPRDNKASTDIISLSKSMFNPIGKFLERSKNMAMGKGFQTHRDVLDRIVSGKVAKRDDLSGGVKLPSIKDGMQLHDSTMKSLRTKSDAELTLMLKDQHALVREQAKKVHGIRGQVIGRLFKNGVPFLSREGKNEYQADKSRLRELQRGRVAIEKVRRDRLEQGQETAIRYDGHGPDGPGGGMPNYFDEHSSEFKSRAGKYVFENGANDNVVHFRPTAHDELNIPLGKVGDYSTANNLVNAFESVRADPVKVSSVAMRLADEASRAGAGDIARIRNSGLLDKELDTIISQADPRAYVYPLKTGDLLFATPDPTNVQKVIWRADSRDGFVKYANESGNLSYQRAVDALEKQTEKGEKSLIIRSANAAEARSAVSNIPPEKLVVAYQQTKDALTAAKGTPGTEARIHEVGLQYGFGALQAAYSQQKAKDKAQEAHKKRDKGIAI